MTVEKKKEIKNVKITYAQFTDMDYVFPGTFYILNALGEYHFICTSSRAEAQKFVDDLYSPGRYSVVCVKLQKTASRQENGEVSVRGISTRRGQQK